MNKNIFFFILLSFHSYSTAGEIALTFDDAPLSGSDFMSGDEKTSRIIKHLTQLKVPDALFFVTTANIQKNSVTRLKRYTEAGFHLANHSHQHLSANKLNAQDYLTDFYRSHLILKDYDNVLKLHRFPFLHFGESAEKREHIYNGLQELSYNIGYTTVDNYEWYINSKAVTAINKGIDVDLEQLRSLYINTLWNSIQFYDQLAKQNLGRSPKHVLLLHENEMAALFLVDLIEFLRSKDWKIISPQEAYSDPIAKTYSPSKLSYNNQGRIAAIAHSQGVSKNDLRHPSEDTDFLDAEFERMQVFKSRDRQ